VPQKGELDIVNKERTMWFLEKPYILFSKVLLVLLLSLPILAVTAGFLLLMLWVFIYILETSVSNYLLAYVPIPLLGFLMVFIIDGFITSALNSEILRKLWRG
jgi:hypothetical protein